MNTAPDNSENHIIEIQAVAIPTRKRRGEIAEAAFLAKASSLGFGVARPWGDSERYDFIVDSGHDCWRVQVKSTGRFAESRYRVKAAGWRATYTRHEIDFLVAYIVPEDLWYVVPIEAVAVRKGLRFYPHGGRKSLLEKYRGAWCLMAAPRPQCGAGALARESVSIATAPNGAKRVSQGNHLDHCLCPELTVRCTQCPLRR